jgi:hypothetical protein
MGSGSEPGPDISSISRENMFEGLLQVCPSFMPKWRAFCEEWKDEADPPYYQALSDLARHLIEMLEHGENAPLEAVFQVVEHWHLKGDPYVREAATIGLLEDLQNTGFHNTTTPDQFVGFLGPESRFWWDKVIAFWEHGHMIVDER